MKAVKIFGLIIWGIILAVYTILIRTVLLEGKGDGRRLVAPSKG